MENPVMLFIANITGIYVGWIVTATGLVCIFGYVFAFFMILKWVSAAREEYDRTGNPIFLVLFVVCWVIVFVLTMIHLLITVGAVASHLHRLFHPGEYR